MIAQDKRVTFSFKEEEIEQQLNLLSHLDRLENTKQQAVCE